MLYVECRKDIVSRRSDVVHYWFPLLQQVASNVAANDSGSSELCWQIVVEGQSLAVDIVVLFAIVSSGTVF